MRNHRDSREIRAFLKYHPINVIFKKSHFLQVSKVGGMISDHMQSVHVYSPSQSMCTEPLKSLMSSKIWKKCTNGEQHISCAYTRRKKKSADQKIG